MKLLLYPMSAPCAGLYAALASMTVDSIEFNQTVAINIARTFLTDLYAPGTAVLEQWLRAPVRLYRCSREENHHWEKGGAMNSMAVF